MPSPLRFVPDTAKLWADNDGNPIAIAEVTIRTTQNRSHPISKPDGDVGVSATLSSKTGRTRFQNPTALSEFLPKTGRTRFQLIPTPMEFGICRGPWFSRKRGASPSIQKLSSVGVLEGIHGSHFDGRKNGGNARESNPPRTPLNALQLVLKTRLVTRLGPLPSPILVRETRTSISGDSLPGAITLKNMPGRFLSPGQAVWCRSLVPGMSTAPFKERRSLFSLLKPENSPDFKKYIGGRSGMSSVKPNTTGTRGRGWWLEKEGMRERGDGRTEESGQSIKLFHSDP